MEKLRQFLVKFRVLSFAITLYLVYFFSEFALRLWQWFELNHAELTTQSAASFSAFVVPVIGAQVWVYKHVITLVDRHVKVEGE